jgi:Circularly permutated YpsA SLOG family
MLDGGLARSIYKIVSGGQTGADIGGLTAARQLGLQTGGFAPKGWLTEDGPRESLLRSFGLIECEEDGYPERTRRNVVHSDGTLLVGDYQRGGSRLTYELAKELNRPLFSITWPNTEDAIQDIVDQFRHWLELHGIKVLNVAGNRESQTPGIVEFTRGFLVKALSG